MSIVLNRGAEKSTLDDKGRVNIPVRFREHFQGDLIITRGDEHCAMILTPSEWEYIEQSVENSDVLTHVERESYKDKYLNQASPVELDNAGRITVPPRIRNYANLSRESRECTVVRDKDRLYIWNSADYEAHLEKTDLMATTARNKINSPIISREN